ncbi:glycosyltransferase family 4 protein [Siphonobacter curvatus]|nr:glycosyltransferase family 4 protein [Siphonobacter curvatus]
MKTGGAQMLVVDILNKVVINNNAYLIIVNDEFDEAVLQSIDSRVKIFFLNRKPGSKNPLYILKLNWILFKIKPKVIHCHEPNIVNLIFYNNVKKILTVHDVGIGNIYINKYTNIVSISETVFKDILTRFNIRTILINNGIDFESFQKRSKYKSINNFNLVQVSRLMHEKKGQHIAIESINILNNLFPGVFTITFIGEGSSESYLKELTKKLNLQSQVSFLGNKNRDWIKKNLHQFDLVIQPSVYEGFGLTILEGIATKNPVIASNIDGPKEILNNFESLFLFESGNPKDLSDKIYEIYRKYTNDLLLPELNLVYERSFIKYDISVMVNKYFDLYFN